MPVTTHKYATEDITVTWKPDICIHSGICAKGLLDVFNPGRRPWIDLSKAEADRIREQIKKCPSGALSFTDKEA
ncbi:MAG: (4Fe-4S)-binding protein [Ferruginibacter sp.]